MTEARWGDGLQVRDVLLTNWFILLSMLRPNLRRIPAFHRPFDRWVSRFSIATKPLIRKSTRGIALQEVRIL